MINKHETLNHTIPNTAGKELLEQISPPSPRVWPHSHHPARWALRCLSAWHSTRTEGKTGFFSAKEDISACFGDFAANNFHMFNYPLQTSLRPGCPACFPTGSILILVQERALRAAQQLGLTLFHHLLRIIQAVPWAKLRQDPG